MPFENGNTHGSFPRKSGRSALDAVRSSIERGIKQMKSKDGKRIGVVRLAEKITKALEDDPIRTLKALAAYMPKDVTIEAVNNKAAEALSDADLAKIIADEAVAKMMDDSPPADGPSGRPGWRPSPAAPARSRRMRSAIGGPGRAPRSVSGSRQTA